ncbi:MAG: NAD-dependent epimerase/dehydratase [Candidatus Taylorbacteria bacterium]|nr:NAD-dependent epimerase/dehydratase [Candidatus Taylorbacteria bacterium]
MKKYIVTGGAGFIGSNLVDVLIERGDEVHIIDNLSGGFEENLNPKAIFHKADIRNIEEIKPLFAGIDGVFHFAALPRVQYSIENPIETNEVNINGTQNILIAAQLAGVKRVVYSASSAAYGNQSTMPLIETMLPQPLSPYGMQKYVGEHICRIWSEIYGIETVSLRYFNVYGPRQSSEGAYALVIARFLKQKKEGQKMTITGDGLQTRDFTHVRDVVRANILAMESDKVGKGEIMNIGGGEQHSVLEIAQMIGGEYEFIAPRIEPRHTLADTTVAKNLIGWEPKEDFVKGVEELKV